MSAIKAIVFDMDGVLVDAKEWHYESLNRALRLFGYEISRYDHLVAYDGLPTRKKLEMLSLENGLPQGLHRFIGRMKQQYLMTLVHTQCKPAFQHQYALAKLKSEGYRIALASNSIRATVDTLMEKCGLADMFEVTLSNEDVDEPKPSPSIYLKAASSLGVSPAQCLVVEDHEYGVASAKTAGARVLKVHSPGEVTYDRLKRAIDAGPQA
jgi:HAD superfamily hydrolase (TIGR01509 family)